MNQIQKDHFALIVKYTGISFITGGLSHGFFSGERQIITSLVGIAFFIAGTLLEQKTKDHNYLRTILYSSILAVSIGALTGGLQHFPDSPERSMWIVPLGFIISVYSYFSLEGQVLLKKKHIIYTIVGFITSIFISLGFYWVVHEGYIGGAGHGHGETGHNETIEAASPSTSLDASTLESTTVVEHNDSDNHFDGDGHDDDH